MIAPEPNQGIYISALSFIQANFNEPSMIFVLNNGAIIQGSLTGQHPAQGVPTFIFIKLQKVAGVTIVGSLTIKIKDIVCWGRGNG